METAARLMGCRESGGPNFKEVGSLVATVEQVRATVPSFVIEIRFEALRPRVRLDAMSEGEASRLVDWVQANPELGALLGDALDLADVGQAP
jgi:hypothetical protein